MQQADASCQPKRKGPMAQVHGAFSGQSVEDHFFFGGAFFGFSSAAVAFSVLAGLSGVAFSCFTTASSAFWFGQL